MPRPSLRVLLEFVKIEHSLFALPFVLAGVALGLRAEGLPAFSNEGLRILALALIAAVAARTGAMTLNRIVDAAIDARNPRTAARALPAGALTMRQAWALAIASFAALVAAAALLNPLVLALSPVLVALFFLYPYTKRFTAWCHFVLGLALGAAPVGGFLAVTGTFGSAEPALLLAAFATLWVAGFDVIYALLDVEVDRREGLHSVPARYGVSEALVFSSTLHVIMLVPLGTLTLFFLPLSSAMIAAIVAIVALLAVEHYLADPNDPAKVNRAFFAVNAVLGWVLLAGVLGSLAGY
ncbi:MAG TPA: UbiA-like polyprenyltransferase [Candidatus Thermoplasmatota archaeon]|nr:UbiA-like polyprenyltransferase [Candidatus Thermoplasmatota archaeon]